MGKIKGWEKQIDRKNKVLYKNLNNSSEIYIYNIKSEFSYKEIYNGQKWMLEFGIGNKSFKTKKEALDYAINYMRANPNG